jgi:K+-transporting ATPase A subunit
MYRVYFAPTARGDGVFGPVERRIYWMCGIDPAGEQRWRVYAAFVFSLALVSEGVI